MTQPTHPAALEAFKRIKGNFRGFCRCEPNELNALCTHCYDFRDIEKALQPPTSSAEVAAAIELLDNEIYSEFGNSPIGMKLQNAVHLLKNAKASSAMAAENGRLREALKWIKAHLEEKGEIYGIYDWNSDPLYLTLIEGKINEALAGLSAARNPQILISALKDAIFAFESYGTCHSTKDICEKAIAEFNGEALAGKAGS